MPDFTIESYYRCISIRDFSYRPKGKDYIVTRSTHGPYEFNWHCTCPSFKYRKRCKHISEAIDSFCGWDQLSDGGDANNKKCPKCHGEAEVYLVGV